MNKQEFIQLLVNADVDEYGNLYVNQPLIEKDCYEDFANKRWYFTLTNTVCDDLVEQYATKSEEGFEIYDRHSWNDDTLEIKIINDLHKNTSKELNDKYNEIELEASKDLLNCLVYKLDDIFKNSNANDNKIDLYIKAIVTLIKAIDNSVPRQVLEDEIEYESKLSMYSESPEKEKYDYIVKRLEHILNESDDMSIQEAIDIVQNNNSQTNNEDFKRAITRLIREIHNSVPIKEIEKTIKDWDDSIKWNTADDHYYAMEILRNLVLRR